MNRIVALHTEPSEVDKGIGSPPAPQLLMVRRGVADDFPAMLAMPYLLLWKVAALH